MTRGNERWSDTTNLNFKLQVCVKATCVVDDPDLPTGFLLRTVALLSLLANWIPTRLLPRPVGHDPVLTYASVGPSGATMDLSVCLEGRIPVLDDGGHVGLNQRQADGLGSQRYTCAD